MIGRGGECGLCRAFLWWWGRRGGKGVFDGLLGWGEECVYGVLDVKGFGDLGVKEGM